MNFLHTFWNSQKQENALLNSGGFLAPEIHYMSWAFSCLQLRKFYKNVELHTNQQGKEIYFLFKSSFKNIFSSLSCFTNCS
jgi:hypothetical protein